MYQIHNQDQCNSKFWSDFSSQGQYAKSSAPAFSGFNFQGYPEEKAHAGKIQLVRVEGLDADGKFWLY